MWTRQHNNGSPRRWREATHERIVWSVRKCRRLLIQGFAALSILVQGVAIAWTAPASMTTQASASSMSVHCNMAGGQGDQSKKMNCCCVEHCDCMQMCGASVGIAVASVHFGVEFTPAAHPLRFSVALAMVPLPVLLDPPIALTA